MQEKGTSGTTMAIFKTIVSVTRDTTANWNLYPNFVPKIGEIIVYMDRYFVDGKNVPDIKVGDGVTKISQLPFIGDTGESYIEIDDVRQEITKLRSDLGNLAFSNSTVASFTPEGTITGIVFNGLSDRISMNGTPSGIINLSEYTPSGSVSKPDISLTKSTDTIFVAESGTGGGTVTEGAAASCTLPVFSMTADGETLNITWQPGEFTANTPTEVTLPSFVQKTSMSDVDAELEESPIFTGDDADISATFAGDSMEFEADYTPYGTISGATFTGRTRSIIARPNEDD